MALCAPLRFNVGFWARFTQDRMDMATWFGQWATAVAYIIRDTGNQHWRMRN
jgi:hypothetical protein